MPPLPARWLCPKVRLLRAEQGQAVHAASRVEPPSGTTTRARRRAAGEHSRPLPRAGDAQADLRLLDQDGAMVAHSGLERKVHGRREWWLRGIHPGLDE